MTTEPRKNQTVQKKTTRWRAHAQNPSCCSKAGRKLLELSPNSIQKQRRQLPHSHRKSVPRPMIHHSEHRRSFLHYSAVNKLTVGGVHGTHYRGACHHCDTHGEGAQVLKLFAKMKEKNLLNFWAFQIEMATASCLQGRPSDLQSSLTGPASFPFCVQLGKMWPFQPNILHNIFTTDLSCDQFRRGTFTWKICTILCLAKQKAMKPSPANLHLQEHIHQWIVSKLISSLGVLSKTVVLLSQFSPTGPPPKKVSKKKKHKTKTCLQMSSGCLILLHAVWILHHKISNSIMLKISRGKRGSERTSHTLAKWTRVPADPMGQALVSGIKESYSGLSPTKWKGHAENRGQNRPLLQFLRSKADCMQNGSWVLPCYSGDRCSYRKKNHANSSNLDDTFSPSTQEKPHWHCVTRSYVSVYSAGTEGLSHPICAQSPSASTRNDPLTSCRKMRFTKRKSTSYVFKWPEKSLLCLDCMRAPIFNLDTQKESEKKRESWRK